MKNEELLDLLGGIDEKFYKEAMDDEPLEAVPITLNKKSGTFFRFAAGFAAAITAAAAAILIYAAMPKDGLGHTLTEEITLTPPAAPEILKEDINFCKKYVLEFQAENTLTGSGEHIADTDSDKISYRLLDLNFDGINEILVTDLYTRCPLFIFEKKDDSSPVLANCIEFDDRLSLDRFRFNVTPYEQDGEKYHYFYMTYEDDTSMTARIAAAIKYDGEGYYLSFLLSYGVGRTDSDPDEWSFFRKGWVFPEAENPDPADYTQMSYEEFKILWEQYSALPVISFVNISKYTDLITDHCQLTYKGVKYDYNFDTWDCLIIDGVVYSLDGKTDWDVYDKNGEYLPSAAAMREFEELEYLDLFGSGDIFTMFFSVNSKMYRCGDNILVLFQIYQESPSDNEIGTDGLPNVPGIKYKKSEYYRVGTYSVCKGHWKYPAFDPAEIPDIKGSSRFGESNGLTEAEKSNYSASYHCYSWACIHSETVGNYRFDLIAQNISTDSEADPDKLYCSKSYILVFNINNPEDRLGILDSREYSSLPLNSDLSDCFVQAYDLKNGIVIYSYDSNTMFYNKNTKIFFTVKPYGDDDALWPLRGDYSSLCETDENFEPIQKPGVAFTADPDKDALYYGGNSFDFDFTNFYEDFNEALPNFSVNGQ